MKPYTCNDRIIPAVKGQYAESVPTPAMFGAYVAKLAGFTMAAEEYIDIAARGSKYILCSGCEVPMNAHKESIDCLMEAAK